jgi:hypothetical protein
MLDKILRYSKALAAAGASFFVTLGLVWQDRAISLDELNVLKAAAVAFLVAVGVAVSPKNRP